LLTEAASTPRTTARASPHSLVLIKSQTKEATMERTNDNDKLFEELDQRESDGISVSLLWRRLDNAIAVSVHDGRSDERFSLRVTAEQALDAFRHPFAYAARSLETASLAVA
jgi:hypothetical protein